MVGKLPQIDKVLCRSCGYVSGRSCLGTVDYQSKCLKAKRLKEQEDRNTPEKVAEYERFLKAKIVRKKVFDRTREREGLLGFNGDQYTASVLCDQTIEWKNKR